MNNFTRNCIAEAVLSYSRLKIVIPNLSENEDEDEDCISRAAINAALEETVNCIERAVEMDKRIVDEPTPTPPLPGGQK